MFVRLVYESFRRQTRRKLLMAVAVTLGAAVSTAMIAIAIDIGDKISHELRGYGANLLVTPCGRQPGRTDRQRKFETGRWRDFERSRPAED